MLQRVCDRCGTPVLKGSGDMNDLDVIVGSDEFLVSYEDLCEDCMSEFRTLVNQYRRKGEASDESRARKTERASKGRWDRLKDVADEGESKADEDAPDNDEDATEASED